MTTKSRRATVARPVGTQHSEPVVVMILVLLCGLGRLGAPLVAIGPPTRCGGRRSILLTMPGMYVNSDNPLAFMFILVKASVPFEVGAL